MCPTSKRCTKCGEHKPLDSFYKGRPGSTLGRRGSCIKCCSLAQKTFRENNKEKIKKYQVSYKPRANEIRMQRYRQDKEFKLAALLRGRVYDALKVERKYKTRSGSKLLGCSYAEYKEYLSRLFTEGMTWEDVMSGNIHIDHIIPCSYFDLSKEESQAACFHFSNTRPVWRSDNLKKSKRILSTDVYRLGEVAHLIKSEKIIVAYVPNQ